MTAGNFFVSYEWTLDGQPFDDADQTLEINAPGVYTVTMTTATGCVRTATMTVIESCDPVVVADIQEDAKIGDQEFLVNSCGNETISFLNQSFQQSFIDD